jgi:hypothetical protein
MSLKSRRWGEKHIVRGAVEAAFVPLFCSRRGVQCGEAAGGCGETTSVQALEEEAWLPFWDHWKNGVVERWTGGKTGSVFSGRLGLCHLDLLLQN